MEVSSIQGCPFTVCMYIICKAESLLILNFLPMALDHYVIVFEFHFLGVNLPPIQNGTQPKLDRNVDLSTLALSTHTEGFS